MIALLLMAMQVVTPPVIPVPVSPAAHAPLPPQDWSTLPVLRIRRSATVPPELSAYVRSEVAAGRCDKAEQAPQGWHLKIDLAVLATPEGRVRRVTPRAIACPTVEQYAAGLVLGSVRGNIDVADSEIDAWYRTSLTFAWDE